MLLWDVSRSCALTPQLPRRRPLTPRLPRRRRKMPPAKKEAEDATAAAIKALDIGREANVLGEDQSTGYWALDDLERRRSELLQRLDSLGMNINSLIARRIPLPL
uniref:Uncharacterized protein n=1 Tax=Arundo donax TaxID=35708 RepID=A0A0A9GSD8_ARUDO